MRMLLIIFPKFFVCGKCPVLGPKMEHPFNSGFIARVFFFNFAQ